MSIEEMTKLLWDYNTELTLDQRDEIANALADSASWTGKN